jgi:ribosomal protein S18 acetylase RimI-like enzyme
MASVRPLVEDEWATFREIRLASLLDSPEAFRSTYGEESAQGERAWRDWTAGRWRGGEAIVFIAELFDEPIGTATGATYDREPGNAYVYAMWVQPDARGAGVGRALLDEVETWARDRGSERLRLDVTETNEAARRFYEACGFRETGEREPLRPGSELNVLVLEKALQGPSLHSPA